MQNTTSHADILLNIPPEGRPFDGDGVYLFYDGPQLFGLPSRDGWDYLFVALPKSAGRYPFLVVEATKDELASLEDNEITIRSLYVGEKERYLCKDYSEDPIRLVRVHEVPEWWLPGDVTIYP